MYCGKALMKHVPQVGSYRILISFIFHEFSVSHIGRWTAVDLQKFATRLMSRPSLLIDIPLNTGE
jgi:hypothetical protein